MEERGHLRTGATPRSLLNSQVLVRLAVPFNFSQILLQNGWVVPLRGRLQQWRRKYCFLYESTGRSDYKGSSL